MGWDRSPIITSHFQSRTFCTSYGHFPINRAQHISVPALIPSLIMCHAMQHSSRIFAPASSSLMNTQNILYTSKCINFSYAFRFLRKIMLERVQQDFASSVANGDVFAPGREIGRSDLAQGCRRCWPVGESGGGGQVKL